MSVKTAADEHLDNVRKHLANAVEELGEIVANECWGHDEFKDAFRKGLLTKYITLLTMKLELGPRRYFDEEDNE